MSRRMYALLIFLSLLFVLSACTKEIAVPIENPEVESFEEVYKKSDFSIFKRTEIDETRGYYAIAYNVGEKDSTCIIGEYHKYNFMILYQDEYYDIVEANKLEIYTCEDLEVGGVINSE